MSQALKQPLASAPPEHPSGSRMKPLVFAVREAIAQQRREAAQEKLRALREGWR